MYNLNWRMIGLAAAVSLAAAGSAVVGESVLTQLGLTESSARGHILRIVKLGGHIGGYEDPMVKTGRAAYRKVPVAARAQVTTELFAWAKAYLDSPAFKSAYASMRAAAKSLVKQYPLTIDEELKKQVDGFIAATETMHEGIRQNAARFTSDEMVKFEASYKESLDKYRDPEFQKMIRAAIEAERAKERESDDAVTKAWEEMYPADPEVLFARSLREFLATTADADYAATITNLALTGPEALEFDNPAYRSKPWQWMEAVIAGKEAGTAARTAAEAWLKEIGSK